ncbi:pentapeptide repeat-containing protein [Rhodanobacter sp. BL-MT-08]
MSKRRKTIQDDEGNHIATIYFPAGTVDLEEGDLSSLCASCISTLRGRSFARSCLYWAMLQDSDLAGCNSEDADLRGANLMGARLVGANLRRANLGIDNLGGSATLQGADLTGAIVNQCNFLGAEYDGDTIFPKGFNPETTGMLSVD